jgi:transcriptional antiterminator RfaH
MDIWRETNWFAVQSKPRQENLAAAGVSECDVEVFLPKVRQEQMVCGIERLVIKPLFTGYFFARFSPVLILDTIRYIRGVLRVVGNAAFPIPLNEEIISAIRGRVESDGFIRLEETRFQPGDRVTIEQGPLAGWIGKVEHEWDDGKRVAILLEAIEQARVLVKRRWLVPVANAV